jgi:TonB-linked SusC/RagA family outer membrane protein
MKNHLLYLLLFMLGSATAFAQNRVTGTVSGSDGVPLIGVSVYQDATTNGTVTDLDGLFEIDVPTGSTLVFSYTGYETVRIPVGNQSTIDVVLNQGVALDEVVVTALGIQREKKALAYSVTEVDAENFSAAREMNVINSLAGQIAGVNVAQTATGAGGSTRVVIRGNSSISGNNQPLYVVDGVPIDNSNLGSAGMWGGQDWGDGISSLNPDDIQTVTVLKGNSAAALYGYRASNGVILITTKSGKARKGIGVEFNSQVRMESLIDVNDFQKEYGHGRNGAKPTTVDEALAQGLYSWGSKLDGSNVMQYDGVSRPYSDVGDNIGRFYETGTTFSNTLALSGGTEKYNFRFSAAALNNEDIVPNSGLDRNTFTLNTRAQLSDRLTANVSATYVNENAQNRPRLSDSPGNANFSVGLLPASMNVDDLKGPGTKLGSNEDGTEFQFNDNVFVTNPWWAAYQFEANSTKNRLLGNVQLRYELIDGLYVRGRLGLDRYDRKRRNLTPYGTAYSTFGQIDEQTTSFSELNKELIIGYDKELSDNITLNVFVGGNQLDNKRETLGSSGNNFAVPFLHDIRNTTQRSIIYGYSQFKVNSLFASAEIGLNRAIYLTGTIRNDWFSTLTDLNGETDNDKTYYSGGVSVVLSDLIAMPDMLDYAKVRATYAEVGGVGAAEDPYGLSLTYGVFGQGHLGLPLGGITNGSIPNANLEPLTSKEFEIGIDLKFWNNRLGVDFAYYTRNTLNDILGAAVSPTSSYGSKIVNIGKMDNSGIELLVSANPIRKDNFRWDISVNFANNKNEVVSLLTETQEDEESLRVSESRTRNAYIHHEEGLPYSQIKGFEYARDASGNIMLDDEGLPMQGDFVSFGTGVHPTSIGINNSFSYKNFNLSFLIDSKSGGYIYGATNAYAYSRGLHKNTLEGRETGIGSVAKEDLENYYGRIFNITEQFVQKADFIKLRQVVLSYNLPKSVLGNLPVEGVSIGLAGRNLALLSSSVDNIDPESTYDAGNGQGLELFGVPQSRSFQFNLGIKF